MSPAAVNLLVTDNITTVEPIIKTLLQKILCTTQQGCSCSCQNCLNIFQNKPCKQLLNIPMESNYGIGVADQILQFTSLKTNVLTPHVCLLQNIENLSLACANRLLKTLEEPPANYFFLLTTQNLSQVLPTIKSRGFITYQSSGNEGFQIKLSPIASIILTMDIEANLEGLFNLIEALEEDNATTMQEFYQLIAVAQKEACKSEPHTVKMKKLINTCSQFSKFPASPGGSKLFWKSLILNLL